MSLLVSDDLSLNGRPDSPSLIRCSSSLQRTYSLRSLSAYTNQRSDYRRIIARAQEASFLNRDNCQLTNQSWISGSIRRRSKADNVDLREGDIVVATNGKPCHGKTHAQAMDVIEECRHNLTLDIIRPAEDKTTGSTSSSSSRANDGSNTTRRTDTVTEKLPDGVRTTTTTVTTQEQSYSMAFSPVQNTKPRPFEPAVSDGPSILGTEVKDGSITMTIGTANETVAPVFKVKNMANVGSTWSPEAQDPYEETTMPYSPATMSMETQEDEDGFGVAIPKVMPATPGLQSMDIQKLLEPAEDETPDTPTRNFRIYLDPSGTEAVAAKKVYADSAFFDDPESKYPTIQEQVKMAHQVAKLLMSEAAVLKSRGSQMFTKRRERAEKWVHEASEDDDAAPTGKPLAPHAVTRKPPPEAFYKSLQKENQIGVWNPMSIPQAPPPPPIVAPTSPISHQEPQDPKCAHTQIAPEKCFNLAAALHASKGRGGQIFAKRRAKSESWVIDDTNVKSPPPPITSSGGATLRQKGARDTRSDKSPWEAALDDGSGFDQHNKRHTVGADVFSKLQDSKKLPNMSNVPKAWSPDKNISSHNFKAELKEKQKFKDFNVKPRGWGGASQSSEEDRRSTRSTSIASSDGEPERRAPTKMAAGSRFSVGYDPRQPRVNRSDLSSALGARGFVAVGSSGASDL